MGTPVKQGDYYFGAHNGTRVDDTYIIGTKESLEKAGVHGLGLDEGEALVYTTLTSATPGYQGTLWIANGELQNGELGKHVNVWNGDPLAERLKELAFKHLQQPDIWHYKGEKKEKMAEPVRNAVLEYVGGL